jgi:hypothetical protein
MPTQPIVLFGRNYEGVIVHALATARWVSVLALAVSLAAFLLPRWWQWLIIASAMLYLIDWTPPKLLAEPGIVVRYTLVLETAAKYGHLGIVVLREIVLPLSLLSATILAAVDLARRWIGRLGKL